MDNCGPRASALTCVQVRAVGVGEAASYPTAMSDIAMIRIAQVTVSLERREVFAGSRPVKLGSRAFDILALLIEARGALVSKDELLAKVWPRSVVEENNLQVHISVLRKVLGGGRDLIKTIPGRGYRLVLDAAPAPEPLIDCAAAEPGGRDRLLIALLERLGLEDMLQEHRPAAPAAIPAPPSAAARSSSEPPATCGRARE